MIGSLKKTITTNFSFIFLFCAKTFYHGFLLVKCNLKRFGKYHIFAQAENTEKESKMISHIRDLPGPKPFPIRLIGNLLQLPKSNDTIIPKFFEWCKKYGPCFRVTLLGKDFVVISNATLAQSVLQSNELEHLTKTDVYAFLKELNGLAFTSGEKWQTMRKIASPAFGYKSLQQRVVYSNYHADELVKYLWNEKNDKHFIELLLATCTVRIIIDSFISGPETSSHIDAMEYVKNWKRYTEITTHRMIHPWLAIDFIWSRHPLYSEMQTIVAKLEGFAGSLIKHHLNRNWENGQEKFLIPQLIKLGYSNDKMCSEVLTMLFGYEAFFFGLFYLTYLLAVHPEHQHKCREEVDLLCKETRGDITVEDLSRLKYLERCLFEALRLMPPAFIYGRKLETELELENGVVLPAGTNALILPLVIHKMSEYYPNPEIFDPDRFLPENCKKRHSYSFLSFSAGPRVCLGMKPAITSVKIIMAKILQIFYISSSDKLDQLKFKVSLAMVPENGLDLVFTPRSYCKIKDK